MVEHISWWNFIMILMLLGAFYKVHLTRWHSLQLILSWLYVRYLVFFQELGTFACRLGPLGI